MTFEIFLIVESVKNIVHTLFVYTYASTNICTKSTKIKKIVLFKGKKLKHQFHTPTIFLITITSMQGFNYIYLLQTYNVAIITK